MLQVVHFRDINCCESGYNPATGRQSLIGQDFVYKWDPVREYATRRGLNLDSFLVLPIAARLFEKKLLSSVLFWFTPMNDVFVVTVCSKRNVNFMNPLHSLTGYVEYGQNYLRPHARPFLYWNGENVLRIHPVLDMDTPPEYLVADFGNLFGLTVAESSPEQYREILENPVDYFDCLAVPEESEQVCDWNGKTSTIQHALCVIE